MRRPALLITQLLVALALAGCAGQKPMVKLGKPGIKPWMRTTQASDALIARGEYDLALKKAHHALAQASKQQNNERNGDVSLVLGHIGKIHRLMYDHHRSATYYFDALKLRRDAFGTDHRYYAQGLLGLGLAYGHQNRRGDAINTLKAALATAERAHGAHHPALVDYLSALAIAYEDNTDFALALPLRERTVALMELDPSVSKHKLAQAQWRAGLTARDQGNPTLATQWFNKGLVQFEAHPASGPSLASRFQTAATAYTQVGQYEQAEKLLIRALGIREETMSFDHPEIVDTYTAIGDLYKTMNRIDDALRYRQYASRARNGINPYK